LFRANVPVEQWHTAFAGNSASRISPFAKYLRNGKAQKNCLFAADKSSLHFYAKPLSQMQHFT